MSEPELRSRIEVFLSATDLPKMDLMSESDPFAVLYLNGVELGRTEVLNDQNDPCWAKQFEMDFMFEQRQTLKVEVYDADKSGSRDLSKHDYLGCLETNIGDLVTSRSKSLNVALQGGPQGSNAKVQIRAEEITKEGNLDVTLQARGIKLDKKDFFGKSDPYLEFFRAREDGQWMKTLATEVVKNTLDPTWKPFKTTAQRLCNCDLDRPLLIKCYDWDSNDEPDLIGECQVSVRDLVSKVGETVTLPLINQKKKAKKGDKYTNSGLLELVCKCCEPSYSFLEYVQSGLNIGLLVAIDFTASNGSPNDPNSLHFMGHGTNAYIHAIREIGQIVAPYDSDRKFPVFGFGGKIRGKTEHCFALSMDENYPEVKEVEGIEGVYRHAMQYVQLSGPTLFAPLLSRMTQIVYQESGKQQGNYYAILLLLTDGVINDMQNTIDQICAASQLPLSIIIIGIGNADFSEMNVLDADDSPLRSSDGTLAARDFVQFVPMNQFLGATAELARFTLEEVPDQVRKYLRSRGVVPKNAKREHWKDNRPTIPSNMKNTPVKPKAEEKQTSKTDSKPSKEDEKLSNLLNRYNF